MQQIKVRELKAPLFNFTKDFIVHIIEIEEPCFTPTYYPFYPVWKDYKFLYFFEWVIVVLYFYTYISSFFRSKSYEFESNSQVEIIKYKKALKVLRALNVFLKGYN